MKNFYSALPKAMISALLFGGLLFGSTAFAQTHTWGGLIDTSSGLRVTINIADDDDSGEQAEVRYYVLRPMNGKAIRNVGCVGGVAPNPTATTLTIPPRYLDPMFARLELTDSESTSSLPTSFVIGGAGGGVPAGGRLCVLVYVPGYPELGAIVRTYDIPIIELTPELNADEDGIILRWNLVSFDRVACAHSMCSSSSFIQTPAGLQAFEALITISRRINDGPWVEIHNQFPVAGRATPNGLSHFAGNPGELQGIAGNLATQFRRFPNQGEKWEYRAEASFRDASFITHSIPSTGNSITMPFVTPTASIADDDQTVDEGEAVTLMGTSDPREGDITLNQLLWSQAADANGNPLRSDDGITRVSLMGEVEVSGPNEGEETADITFTAPTFPTRTENVSLYFRFQATDDDAQTPVVATVVVRVTDDPPSAFSARFSSERETITEGENVTLIGTGGVDPEGATVTYEWTQVADADGSSIAPAHLDFLRVPGSTNAAFPVTSAQPVVFVANPRFTDNEGNDRMETLDDGGQAPLSSVTLYFLVATSYSDCGTGQQPACPTTLSERGITVTVQRPAATSAAVEEALINRVLPETLRNITNSVNQSIFQRIQERQRQEGKWK